MKYSAEAEDTILKNKKALSLIEVSIAVFILAIVCSGTMVIFARGYELGKESRDFTSAVFFAQEVMEDYFDWGTVSAMNGTYTNPPNPVTRNNITYTPTLSVIDSPAAPPGSSELKQLDVTVSWGSGQSFTLKTMKGNY